MAAGNNVVFLPGYNRAPLLNPATFAEAIPSTRGGIRWLELHMLIDVALAATQDVELATSFGTFKSELSWLTGAATWPLSDPLPLIRGSSTVFNGASGVRRGFETSVWVPDPMLLFLRVLQMAGTETLTVAGVFIETNDRDNPPPDLYR